MRTLVHLDKERSQSFARALMGTSHSFGKNVLTLSGFCPDSIYIFDERTLAIPFTITSKMCCHTATIDTSVIPALTDVFTTMAVCAAVPDDVFHLSTAMTTQTQMPELLREGCRATALARVLCVNDQWVWSEVDFVASEKPNTCSEHYNGTLGFRGLHTKMFLTSLKVPS